MMSVAPKTMRTRIETTDSKQTRQSRLEAHVLGYRGLLRSSENGGHTIIGVFISRLQGQTRGGIQF